MILSSKELFEKARKGGYAIPAANYVNLESARAYVRTAEKLKKPLILAFAQAKMDMLSLEEAALIGKYFAETASVPIVLHLDHGQDYETICKAISLGFNSVMIDASMKPWEENIALTRQVVDYAHRHGVVVESEIGHVGSGTNYENHELADSVYTKVEDAIEFVEKTKTDSLAISIGTAHGFYQGTPKINFDLLHEIRDAIDVPLVLHGGSSSGDTNLNRCAREGISKINIFTDFMVVAAKSVNEIQPKDYCLLSKTAEASMAATLVHLYDVFETQEEVQ